MDEHAVAAAVLAGPDAIVAADTAGVITYWNAGAERIFGYPAAEARGASLDLIIPERLRDRHWQGWRRVMDTGRSRYGDADVLAVPGRRRDGTPLSVEFSLHPVRDPDGAVRGIAATLRDVTARFTEVRQLRRELAALRSATE